MIENSSVTEFRKAHYAEPSDEEAVGVLLSSARKSPLPARNPEPPGRAKQQCMGVRAQAQGQELGGNSGWMALGAPYPLDASVTCREQHYLP